MRRNSLQSSVIAANTASQADRMRDWQREFATWLADTLGTGVTKFVRS